MPTKLLSNKTEIPFYNPVKHRLPKNYVKSLLLFKLNVLLFKFYDVTAILAIWPCCSKTATSTTRVTLKIKDQEFHITTQSSTYSNIAMKMEYMCAFIIKISKFQIPYIESHSNKYTTSRPTAKQKLKWICNDSTDIFNGSKCSKFNVTK